MFNCLGFIKEEAGIECFVCFCCTSNRSRDGEQSGWLGSPSSSEDCDRGVDKNQMDKENRYVAAWNAYSSIWDLPPASTIHSHTVTLVLGV